MSGKIRFDRDYGKLIRTETQSGYTVKELYTSEDVKDLDYAKDLADPGKYPYTRGIYPKMYRQRLWLKSLIVSYTTPEETNRAFKKYIQAGQTGLRLCTDANTLSGIDPDHPLAKYNIACHAMPFFALTEYEVMLEGVPLEHIDFESANSTAAGSFITYCLLVALMEKRGAVVANLRGTNINDPIHSYIVYSLGLPEGDFPLDVARKINLDLIEYGAKHTPLYFPCTPNGYDTRDYGLNSHKEVTFVIGNAIQYYGDAMRERGVSLDDLRPMAFSMSLESDFFENIAKFRATRRLWARIARERLGAKKPSSWKCRIGCRTAGNSLYPQKPVNNITRVALQILAGVLGGIQSIDPSGIDDSFGLPSEEGRLLEMDMQHIIAHEANVPLTSDPLAGSYYVEWLTNEIEERAEKLLEEVDRRGGMWECLKSGWLRSLFEEEILKIQDEIERKERLIVGVNAFQGEDGPISKVIRSNYYKVSPSTERVRFVEKVRRLKETRDQKKVVDALTELYNVEKEGKNCIHASINAFKAYATIGEVVGVIRMAHGYSYDPFDMIEVPRYLKRLE